MNQSVTRFTAAAAGVVSLITIILLPLIFLPFTANFFDLNKQLLLIVATALLLILWAIQSLANRSITLHLLPFSMPLMIFGSVVFSLAVLKFRKQLD